MNYRIPYLTTQIIPYIGNKRSLLPFIGETLKRYDENYGQGIFFDLFAGSGVVSRLAKALGYSVIANDWEFYAYVINQCYIRTHLSDLDRLFVRQGGIDQVVKDLNRGMEVGTEGYISTYYAPQKTETADYRKERLFYTAENARAIDYARTVIEDWYPGFDLPEPLLTEKFILLAVLLYGAATHTNTSGVFKAYHKGFGGHSRDALKRIMAPIRMFRPVLINSPSPMWVLCEDANKIAGYRTVDIAYLDPPYNQHQYGSNYHLLNTIALWDCPPVNNSLSPKGSLINKGGIRHDWVKTKSPYCYRPTALTALKDLLQKIDARLILVSYNTEGLLTVDEMIGLLEERGTVELVTKEYVRYRGGKQSIQRKIHNIECLLIVRCDRHQASRRQVKQVYHQLWQARLQVLLRQTFHPQRIKALFPTFQEEGIIFTTKEGKILLPMRRFYQFLPERIDWEILKACELPFFCQRLIQAEFKDYAEEIEVLLTFLLNEICPEEAKIYSQRIVYLLRKLAHKKYQELFHPLLERVERILHQRRELLEEIGGKLSEIKILADKRFKG